MSNKNEKILIIKFSALGDFLQSLAPMQAIREHHPNAHLVLLTTKPYQAMAEKTGYFQEVWLDEKPKFTNVKEIIRLRKFLRESQFNRVYDLQTSSRSSKYHHLLRPHPPEWSGIAYGSSHPHKNPQRNMMPTFARFKEQLSMAGITSMPERPDLKWMTADIDNLHLSKPYVLLVPGSSPGGLVKRWPAEYFGELAKFLNGLGYLPVILGTAIEKEIAAIICKICPEARDLTGQTTLDQIAELARHALCAVGNDTGPSHLIAALGTPLILLWSEFSSHEVFAPKWDNVKLIYQPDLTQLPTEQVNSVLKEITRS